MKNKSNSTPMEIAKKWWRTQAMASIPKAITINLFILGFLGFILAVILLFALPEDLQQSPILAFVGIAFLISFAIAILIFPVGLVLRDKELRLQRSLMRQESSWVHQVKKGMPLDQIQQYFQQEGFVFHQLDVLRVGFYSAVLQQPVFMLVPKFRFKKHISRCMLFLLDMTENDHLEYDQVIKRNQPELCRLVNEDYAAKAGEPAYMAWCNRYLYFIYGPPFSGQDHFNLQNGMNYGAFNEKKMGKGKPHSLHRRLARLFPMNASIFFGYEPETGKLYYQEHLNAMLGSLETPFPQLRRWVKELFGTIGQLYDEL